MKTLFKLVLLRLVNSYFLGFRSIIIDVALDILIFITNKDLALGLEGFLEQIYTVNKAEYSKPIDEPMKIVAITRGADRLITFHIHNNHLLEGKKAMQCVFNLLKNNDTFIKFSDTKVIFTVAEFDDCELSYHKNVLITNKTTFNEYWDEIKDYVNEKYLSSSSGYGYSVVKTYVVRVWDVHHLANKNIKIHKSKNGQIESNISGKGFLLIKSLFYLSNFSFILQFKYHCYLINKKFKLYVKVINSFQVPKSKYTIKRTKINNLFDPYSKIWFPYFCCSE